MSISNISGVGTWHTLSNGIRVLLNPDTSNEIVSLVLFQPLGSSIESPDEAGLVSFTSRMRKRGTRSLNNAELSEAIDSLGGSISCDSSLDYSEAHLLSTKDTFETSLKLLSEMVLYPSFEPEEIEKERQTTIAAIRRSEDDRLSVTLRKFFTELYPGHGYGLPDPGYVKTVGEFKREQLLNFHEEQLRPETWIISVVGNFDSHATIKLLDNLLGGVISPVGAFPDLMIPVPSRDKTTTITKEGEQACLVVGYGAPALSDKLYLPTRVLNAVLGEGMSSRIFSELREKRGLAYATGSSYAAKMLGGQLFGYIGTKPESLEEARTEMLNIFRKIKEEPVPQDELDRSKQLLLGRFLIDHQTNFKRAFYPGYFEMVGLGASWDERYAEEIMKINAKQVREAANAVLQNPVIVDLKV